MSWRNFLEDFYWSSKIYLPRRRFMAAALPPRKSSLGELYQRKSESKFEISCRLAVSKTELMRASRSPSTQSGGN
jgi:hypothetical protein